MASTNTNADKLSDNGRTARLLLGQLAESEQLSRVRPAAVFNLQVALAALRAEGVAGTLTLRIPAKANGNIEIEYASTPY